MKQFLLILINKLLIKFLKSDASDSMKLINKRKYKYFWNKHKNSSLNPYAEEIVKLMGKIYFNIIDKPILNNDKSFSKFLLEITKSFKKDN